ncbi:Lrp/AsnC family transcriptional regulator [Alicyclobacillus dauci]|uniref:Lrp/AsnC family transcriptional regulator n=1 Tax=Alicyclobacillus dauci TaxID=1475485 RepID=A0ABY6Z181_9BACL|nr:Lrp/AsnC family transcriptional regulator [Alicyclobacillus dauci]WAH36642.1 Lrp/AsnC family transcriptional regulator [Alicyclobacillus dauci]
MSSSGVEIDKLNLQIIAYLQEDGRRSFREIAELVGVSERTVRLRVAQLKEQGVIQIVGVVNLVKLGLQVVVIAQIAVEEPHLEEMIERLRQIPEIRFVALTSGEYQLMVQAVSDSQHHLIQFLKNKLHTLPHVRKTNVIMELEVYKNEFGFLKHTHLFNQHEV